MSIKQTKGQGLMIPLLAAVAMFFCVSCGDDDGAGPGQPVGDIEEINIDEEFDYATLQDIELAVTVLNNDGQPVQGVRIYSFKQPFPEDGTIGEVLVSGITQANGVYSVSFQLPTYITTLYLKADVIGTYNEAEVSVAGGGVIRYTFGGVQPSSPMKDGSYRLSGGSQYPQTDGHWDEPPNTGIDMSLLIRGISGIQVAENSEIACFTPAGLLAGVVVIDSVDVKTQWGMAVWGDDPGTQAIDGFREGEALALKYWDAGYDEEMADVRITVVQGAARFAANTLLVVNVTVVPPLFTYLGDYDNHGVPEYLDEDNEEFDAAFLEELNRSLPEYGPLWNHHPEYLVDEAQSNLVISDSAEVWVGFVHEGAAYRNALGFYTYETGNPPQSVDDVERHIVIFPNTSYPHLQTGNRVRIGLFPPNTTIGWFIAANGWNGREVTRGQGLYYSNSDLNPEEIDSLRRHNVLLTDEERQYLILGFEDLRRDAYCDHDFNDVIFSITAIPWDAVDDEDVPPIDFDPADGDGDGVRDVVDDYPDDSTRAFDNFYPGQDSYGAIAFEDLWPRKGDYDFNDLVIAYRFNQITDARNRVVDIIGNFDIKAVGASFHNGFGIQMPIEAAAVASVQGTEINDNYIRLAQNGVEADQTQAVVIIFDDTYPLISPPNGYRFVNTEEGSPLVEAPELLVTVHLAEPIGTDRLSAPPYNPFLIANRHREVEIHLVDYPPTDLANVELFGTDDDASQANINKYYRSDRNLAWALLVPGDWWHVIERVQFIRGYPNCVGWMTSGGVENSNWYLNEGGNINWDYIWQAP